MEQKRVSFNIAKVIKEAGYDEVCDYGYCVVNNVPTLVKTEEEWERHAINNSDMWDFLMCTCQEKDGENDCVAPTYLDVWLWLWREKRIDLQMLGYKNGKAKCYIERETIHEDFLSNMTDPEEAIIAAIEYLVTNDLIK